VTAAGRDWGASGRLRTRGGGVGRLAGRPKAAGGNAYRHSSAEKTIPRRIDFAGEYIKVTGARILGPQPAGSVVGSARGAAIDSPAGGDLLHLGSFRPLPIRREQFPQGTWFVLHTRSRQEKILSRELAARGVHHYLPLLRQVRYYNGRKAVVEEPLFPSYVFLLGTAEQAFEADRTKRVANIIRVADQSQIDWELRNLQMATEGTIPLDPYPSLTKGRRVEVRSGPFQGLQGIVEDRDRDRLVLLVNVLGRGVSLDLHGAQVDLLD
jgi:transcription antitermination factor NusG